MILAQKWSGQVNQSPLGRTLQLRRTLDDADLVERMAEVALSF